jgi:hypothetical protein
MLKTGRFSNHMNRSIASRLALLGLLMAAVGFCLAGNAPSVTSGSLTESETAANNQIVGWSDSLWTQTSQSDFDAGLKSQVDTASSPDNILLEKVSTYGVIAIDDFESVDWFGGSGWATGWWASGNASITTTGPPYSGSYNLRFRSDDGYADRAVDLSPYNYVHLQLWAMADSFETSEYMQCRVTPDGTNWYVLKDWVDGDDDGIYRFWDFDLSAYTMSSIFYIAFDAQMADTSDYFYIDDIQLVTVTVYQTSGTLASQVLNTGSDGTIVDCLSWDETLPASTNLTLKTRGSDIIFNAGDATPPWHDMGWESPVISGLPTGRYVQWQVTLITADTAVTPTLSEVRVYYH